MSPLLQRPDEAELAACQDADQREAELAEGEVTRARTGSVRLGVGEGRATTDGRPTMYDIVILKRLIRCRLHHIQCAATCLL